jgi:hypothetical protein
MKNPSLSGGRPYGVGERGRVLGRPMRFEIDGFGCLADRHRLMESPAIDFVGRLQECRKKGLLLLEALDHRAHVVATLHDLILGQCG